MFFTKVYNGILLVSFIINSILFFPLILLAYLSSKFGKIYYYWVIRISNIVVLNRADHEVRTLLFAILEKEQERWQRPLKILEVGPGTGGNFKYYPEGCQISTLELNAYIGEYISGIKEQFPNLSIKETFLGNVEDMKEIIPNGAFDVVVGTHILCCIRNRSQALQEISRILAPDGVFCSLEMVYYDRREHPFKRFFQVVYAPVHRFFALGCRAGSQDCKPLLTEVGFDVSEMKLHFTEDVPFPYSLSFYGLARKVTTEFGREFA